MPEFLSPNDKLLVYESDLWNGEFSFLAGVDEAGRGTLAGPVVAAAVVFTDHFRIPAGLNDSKLVFFGDGTSNEGATWEAMAAAVGKVIPPAQFVLVDGNPVHGLPLPSQNIVKGDAKSASIAAASILAKTHRDHLMTALAEQYPQYGFEIHKGYGTAQHLAALREHGVSPVHRKTFAPVRDILHPTEFTQQDLFS